MQAIRGLHHITAIASDVQANVDFFEAVLGQRLVKTTVNFDDPLGHPGRIGKPKALWSRVAPERTVGGGMPWGKASE